MKCRKAKKFIHCYSELKEVDKNALELHLESCPSCRSELEWHKASMGLFKRALAFEDKEVSWEGFVDQLPLESKPQSWLTLVKEKLNDFIRLVVTPVWGPVPAYVLSLIIVFVASFGIYSSLLKRDGQTLRDIVVYDKEYLSSVDDGEKTIYFGQR